MSIAAVAAVEVIVGLVVVGLAIAGVVVGWERYRPGRHGRNPRAQPTTEVFIDPETGRRVRVWYDKSSGTREYRED